MRKVGHSPALPGAPRGARHAQSSARWRVSALGERGGWSSLFQRLPPERQSEADLAQIKLPPTAGAENQTWVRGWMPGRPKGAARREKNRRGSAWVSKVVAGWQNAALVARWISCWVFD